jgi:hypothetical protein
MKNKKLNPEDQEMLEAFEEGKFQSDLTEQKGDGAKRGRIYYFNTRS